MRSAIENTAEFANRLVTWFRGHKRRLPWRENPTPYKTWISEMMLQQTQVKIVVPYFNRWMREIPSVRALSRAPEEKILRLWQGLGYYTRARQIRKAARMILNDHSGRIPDTRDAIQKLPGIGPYTAGAILSIAFNRPECAIDGNILRVFARLFALREPVNTPGARDRILSMQKQMLPDERPGEFIEALMELGALVCLPKDPACGSCPVRLFCGAFREGLTNRLPVRVRRPPSRKVNACALVVERKGRFLMARRPAGELMGGFWEFPEWKIRGKGAPGRRRERALLSRVAGTPCRRAEFLCRIRRHYTRFAERLSVWQLADPRPGGRLVLKTPFKTKWITLRELTRLPLTSAHSKIRGMVTGRRAYSGPRRAASSPRARLK